MYEKGQVVYTSREIVGWFDKSMERMIPANTTCIIEKIYRDLDNPENKFAYSVRFLGNASEFGVFTLNEDDLKDTNV